MLPQRWTRFTGYRELLSISLPLMVSMSAATVMEFTDRVFLARYSVDTIAAALPGAIMSFLATCFFMGVAGYINVFVAQYHGSGSRNRVGATVWLGIYFSILSTLILSSFYFAAPPIFRWAGHNEAVQHLEIVYFRILILGAGIHVLGISLAGFFTGRGQTRPVMVVNLLGSLLNIPLDYALINGLWIFPELGIAGAGLATVISWTLVTVSYLLLIFTKTNRQDYGLWREKQFDLDLFKRLMRFGFPAGVQFFIEMFSFTFFIFMVGRIGKNELVATNLAFSMDTLAFLPIVGLSIGVSTLVGQAIGRNQPEAGNRIVANALHVSMAYMGTVALIFVTAPHYLIELFHTKDISPADYFPIQQMGTVLLRFVAFYTIFDSLGMVYMGAVRGAGDTKFVMYAMATIGLTLLVIPTWLLTTLGNRHLFLAWIFAAAYISVLSLVLRWRFRQGKWKKMRVIETEIRGEKGRME